MKFKYGDRVTVTRSLAAIADADRRGLTGRGYLPGRGHSTQPIDFSAQGRVRGSNGDSVAVKWDNPRYGDYWYRPEYLMPRYGGGF